MATVTWLGEEDGPDANTWKGIVFKKGVPVQVTDREIVEKAKNNRFYRVDDHPPPLRPLPPRKV